MTLSKISAKLSKRLSLTYLLVFFFLCSTSACADTPNVPANLDSTIEGCSPRDEICGDGVDQNCDGEDLLCPAPDRDRDGYPSAQDCDDTSRKIYPGISVSCSADCGLGTKTCQSSGSFTSCSCEPLCEATNGGKCYYISKLTGSDQAVGSFTKPWKTSANIVTYYHPSLRPANWVQLKPGDVVYFMSGIYNRTYEYIQNDHKSLFFRGMHGTREHPITLKAYPGNHPVIAPFIENGTVVHGINLYQANNYLIEGFEVTKTYGSPVHLRESNGIELRNMWVHHADGSGPDNISGIKNSTCENITIHHSLLHDVYDHRGKNSNSRQISFFSGGNNKVLYSVIFNTPDLEASSTGGGIVYKHVATVPGATFEVGHNVLWNCAMTSIGSGTFNSHIHHNLIIDSVAPLFANHGGGTIMRDNVVEYNTIVGPGLLYNPTSEYAPIGMLTFRNNIVIDNAKYSYLVGSITIATYGDEALYNDVVGGKKLSFSNNCYHHTIASPQFNLFSKPSSFGGYWNLGGWQEQGYDTGSFAEDPKLNQFHLPTAPNCMNFGWAASH